MYDPIFVKSFSQYDRKRFGFCALILCFITALGISSSNFKPDLHHPLSLIIGDAVNLYLSSNAVEDRLIVDDATENSDTTVGNSAQDLQSPAENSIENKQLVVNETSDVKSQQRAIKKKKVKPICRTSRFCEIEGDIRIHANSSTVFVVTTPEIISGSTDSWIVQPYPRNLTSRVKNWTLKLVGHLQDGEDVIPKCTQIHRHPAILFSVGGYTGNLFHDFADLLFPLYSTSFHFQKEVHFLASDYKQWWINKYRKILDKFTRHEIVNIDREKAQVHCFNKMFAGVKFYRELIMDASLSDSPTGAGLSMQGFRQLLGEAYCLERKMAIESRKGDGKRPRLMIISRKRTRILTNEDEVSRLATKLGYDVVSAEAEVSTNISRFAQTVNSCDVLMGIHGAGLTNMVFLPDKAVVIQVVPFGAIDAFARIDFGNPASGMNLRYLDYKITVDESSLREKYPIDHPILRDPKSFGEWHSLWSIYLEKQNVIIDLQRFRGTLAKALRLLRH